MGNELSKTISKNILNELIGYFSFLHDDSSFSVSKFRVEHCKFRLGSVTEEIVDFLHEHISKNIVPPKSMLESRFYEIYISRRLMCLFFNFPFTEPNFNVIFGVYNDNESNYFTWPENKSKFKNITDDFKQDFYRIPGYGYVSADKTHGYYSPDTEDIKVIAHLENLLWMDIFKNISDNKFHLIQIIKDASKLLNEHKIQYLTDKKKASNSLFSNN
jgi:hypothetical protein